MSNVLKVSLQTTTYSLAQRGWSQRRIAKELGINRETFSRYLRLPKPAISITGNLVGKEESKPAISIAGIGAGRRSRCEALAEVRRRATVGVETWIPPSGRSGVIPLEIRFIESEGARVYPEAQLREWAFDKLVGGAGI
jgi:Homeodomain-like domain